MDKFECCPIVSRGAYITVCGDECAWHTGTACAMQSIPDLVHAVLAVNQMLFDTLGSAKTGDALDAICSIDGKIGGTDG